MINAERYVVTNFAYGTGPYLRTTELICALNDERERRGQPRLPAIIPLVYGERQREVMREEFVAHDRAHPGELLLDPKLGELLGSVFYANSTYEESLKKWIATANEVSKKIRAHLSSTIVVETVWGAKQTVDARRIVAEINRSPRIHFGVAPAFSTTFGYVADILGGALRAGRSQVDADPELLKKGVALADAVEGRQELHCMAYPATFSWSPDFKDRYGGTLVPPITSLPKTSDEDLAEGLFVTITGIPGLERLYTAARALGLRLYSNLPNAVPGSVKALPQVVRNPAIRLQFARSGWGSVWLSMLSGTPIVVPEFDSRDDPEIYFNNRAVEALGIGIVYRGQPLAEILTLAEEVKKRCAAVRADILARWGTLAGNDVCAKLIADRLE